VNQPRPIRYLIYALVALAIFGAWKLQAIHLQRLLVGRESDPNPVKAERVAHLHRSRSSPLPFTRTVVDGNTRLNGRKPKVIIDPDGHGGVVGAQDGLAGFALYRPGKPPRIIDAYRGGGIGFSDIGGIGFEDAQATDFTGNRYPDIVVGGLDNVTYVLYNPRDDGCSDVYRCTWNRSVIDQCHPSHDVVTGDVDRDGSADIATESGIYFNRGRHQQWLFVGRNLIGRDGEGTTLANIANDGILDILAPYRSGAVLARFVNPLHLGGDPTRDAWKAQVIDAHPLFSGNMTTAIADVNDDGHNDIVLAPMYGGGGLMWYEAPKNVSGVWQRHMIDPTVNFVHQGSLQIGDFSGDGHPDIAFAEQDQSPTRRVGVFYNVKGNATSWHLQILSLNGGQNIKVGDIGSHHRLSILTARHGYFGGANPLVLWAAPSHPTEFQISGSETVDSSNR
jgi:hypothetical protein